MKYSCGHDAKGNPVGTPSDPSLDAGTSTGLCPFCQSYPMEPSDMTRVHLDPFSEFWREFWGPSQSSKLDAALMKLQLVEGDVIVCDMTQVDMTALTEHNPSPWPFPVHVIGVLGPPNEAISKADKLVIRYWHAGFLMNFSVCVELNGVKLWSDPFYYSEEFRARIEAIEKALGTKAIEIDKWYPEPETRGKSS